MTMFLQLSEQEVDHLSEGGGEGAQWTESNTMIPPSFISQMTAVQNFLNSESPSIGGSFHCGF